MERAERIAIAKQLLHMIDRGEIQYGEEPAWEADISRFTDKERFLKEKEAFFLNRPQVLPILPISLLMEIITLPRLLANRSS